MPEDTASDAELTKAYRDNIVGIYASRVREHLRRLQRLDTEHQERAKTEFIPPAIEFAFGTAKSRERHLIDRLLNEAATRASVDLRDGLWFQLPLTGSFFRSIEDKILAAADLPRDRTDPT